MAITIREAVLQDLPGILSLYSVYIMETTHTFEYVVPSLDSFRERFEAITEQFPWLVCEVDGELAGYAYASAAFKRAAYQWDADLAVYLDSRYHRRGIASALYSCLIDLLKLQGYYNLYAVITADNTSSISFHRTFGFADIGIFHKSGYKMGTWLDVQWMEKSIRHHNLEPSPCVPFRQLPPGAAAVIFSSRSMS